MHQRLSNEGRITSVNWDLYDTRHVVFQPARLSPENLEAGYWRAYREFYRWGSIFNSAVINDRPIDQLRHIAYAGGWKKFEPLWDIVIKARRLDLMTPLLEGVLSRATGGPVKPSARLPEPSRQTIEGHAEL